VRRAALPLKACRKCKMLVPLRTEQCPNCGSNDFSTDWSGLVIILDPEKSVLADRLEIRRPGKYALKVR